MGSNSCSENYSTGRRQFLKSILGLGGVIETKAAEAAGMSAGSFIWTSLKTGQVGFPTGTEMKRGLPGSLMKLICAAAIRDMNLLPGNVTFECRGSILVRNVQYSCQTAHGRLDLVQAIAHSCNVFFAQAASSVSPALLLSYARKFGLDRSVAGFPSGAFPEEAHGDSQSYALGLSEDLQPQPLQILQLSALIATRGHLPALHSAEDLSAQYSSPEVILSPAAWDLLREGMRFACRAGTGRELDPEDKLQLAIKTGTAPHGKTFQSWITGYFPADAPRHAFCARAPVGTSQTSAVPLARRFLFAQEWP